MASLYGAVKLPSIRNGVPAPGVTVARASALPEVQYFVRLGQSANVTPEVMDHVRADAGKLLEGSIAAHYVHIYTVMQRAEQAAIGGAAALAWTPTQQFIANAKKYALYLGALRVGGMLAWNLAEADLKPNESTLGIMEIAARANGAGYECAMLGTATAEQRALITAMPPITAVDAEVAAIMATAAPGLLVQVGVCLVKTNHHYLSGTFAEKRATAIMKQATSGATPEAAQMIERDVADDQMNSIIFHGAFHPVQETLLAAIARDETTAEKLVAVGLGASAVGVPAEPATVVRGRASVAILVAVDEALSRHGSYVDREPLAGLLAEYDDPATTPAERTLLVDHRIPAACLAMAPGIAYAGGFAKEMTSNMSRKEKSKFSQLTAYSVQNAMDSYIGQTNNGAAYYLACARFDRDRAAAGDISTSVFSTIPARETALKAAAEALRTSRETKKMVQDAVRAGTINVKDAMALAGPSGAATQ